MNPQTILVIFVIALIIVGISIALIYTFGDQAKEAFSPITSLGSGTDIENKLSAYPTGGVIYIQLSKLLHE